MAYPTFRQASGHCYDTSRKQWFMFGGAPGAFTSTQNAEKWKRSQAGVWTLIGTDASDPSSRVMTGCCYLSSQDVYLVACGRISNVYTTDTYWYNPATNAWTAKSAAPVSRAYFGNLVWDSANSRAVLFGGYNGSVLSTTILYNPGGNAWTTPSPATSPSGRASHNSCWNSSRSRVVLFGGDTGAAVLQDTWEWDGTTWADRTPSGTKPTARRNHAMWYDPARDAIYVFGGSSTAGVDTGTSLSDLWKGVWNAGTSKYDWTQQTALALPTSPLGRSYPAIGGYEADNACAYLFSGLDNNAAAEGQGWKYLSAPDKWRSDLGAAGSARQSTCNAGFGG